MTPENIAFLIRDDLRRRVLEDTYDPIAGIGSCGERVTVCHEGDEWRVPKLMTLDPEYAAASPGSPAWKRLRCSYDFEFWFASCAYIKPKGGNRPVLCKLNEGQRHVVGVLEADRVAGRPMRAVVLKARQWGCSTLIQLYIAWLQTCVMHGANAAICAHRKDTSATVRGMYTRLLAGYPDFLREDTEKPALRNFEGSADIKSITGRDCTLMIGSCVSPDAVRGSDISLAHLTEVAYWRNSASVSPEDVAQSIYGTVNYAAGTLVVLESTANGVGNYFHREWLRAKTSGSKRAIFVPWCELSANSLEPAQDAFEVFKTFDETERALFDAGLSLAQIYWRRCKQQEFNSDERFNSEFPFRDTEAFASNDCNVFDAASVEQLRESCDVPAETGGIAGKPVRFAAAQNGRLRVWRHPQTDDEAYVVAVDVGGRSAASDWSVVAVMKAPDGAEDVPEVVAQWRGHVDHDILVRKAVDIARYFNDALLVVESNTLETEHDGSSAFVLEEAARTYRHVYVRRAFDSTNNSLTKKYGFHTNRRTKTILIDNLIAAVRSGAYIERDHEACDELINYRRFPNGSMGAEAPMHDDILMTRALALFVLATEPRTAPVDLPPQLSW